MPLDFPPGCNQPLHPVVASLHTPNSGEIMLEPKDPHTWHAYAYTLPSNREEGGMWLHWLVRMRWLAVAAQAIVIAFALPVLSRPIVVLPALLAVMAVLVVANVRATKLLESGDPVDQATLVQHLELDIVALTVIFLMTGGPTNPFVMLFLVHATMAAGMLKPQFTAAVLGVIVACFTILHLGALPLELNAHRWMTAGGLLAAGQWVAFMATMGSISFFAVGMANGLRRREEQLRAARAQLGQPNTEEVKLMDLPAGHPVHG